MKELQYFHGDIIKTEYPEHLDWFVPGLLKNMNKLVADFEVRALDEKVDYSKNEISVAIKVGEEITEICLDFRSIDSSDRLIRAMIDSINELSLEALGGLIIIAYRPFNDSN